MGALSSSYVWGTCLLDGSFGRRTWALCVMALGLMEPCLVWTKKSMTILDEENSVGNRALSCLVSWSGDGIR